MINIFIAAVVTIKFCFFIQVKFNFDAIDETDLLEETLKPRVESIGGTLEKVSLSGNHITPCIQVNRCARLIACFGFLYFYITDTQKCSSVGCCNEQVPFLPPSWLGIDKRT